MFDHVRIQGAAPMPTRGTMVANNPLIRLDFLRVALQNPPLDSHVISLKTPREPVLAIPSKRASNVAILAWQSQVVELILGILGDR